MWVMLKLAMMRIFTLWKLASGSKPGLFPPESWLLNISHRVTGNEELWQGRTAINILCLIKESYTIDNWNIIPVEKFCNTV